MAKYTIELNELISLGFHLNLDDYPIFNEDYRAHLNKEIIEHFYFREIGQEPPERFNFFLKRKMAEIMPYYNQLYQSELIKFDPLSTVYMETSGDTKRKKYNENTNDYNQNNTLNASETYASNIDRSNTFKLEDTQDTTNNSNYQKSGDRTQDIVTNELTTNDLKTETNTVSDSDGTTDTNGVKNTVFSDIPQAGITTTTTTAPDGTITTETTGYATTTTNESTNEHSTTTAHQTSDSVATNTGTVNVDGKSNLTENWKENGSAVDVGNSKQNQNSNEVTNTKEDYQKANILNEKTDRINREHGKEKENIENTEYRKGRLGVSPSDLLIKYRQTFLNIDMLIINDLETLFMGVF